MSALVSRVEAVTTLAADDLSRVREYHERTKHQLHGYARGPETLDWDAQPAPFRGFEGAEQVPLPSLAETEPAVRRALSRRAEEVVTAAPVPFSLGALAALLKLSVGITAWKQQGPDRWAVRANPSSGNLHPVEVYALVTGSEVLPSGAYHYQPDHHALERRATYPVEEETETRVVFALTSVMWREAWKYGERGFRYCQLDVGHAMSALQYAAGVLGYRLRELRHVGSETLAATLGLDRAADFTGGPRHETEREEAEVLLELELGPELGSLDAARLRRWTRQATFAGRASTIDRHPMYSWPWIDEAARATRAPDDEPPRASARPPALLGARAATTPLARLLLERRSAQRFDGRFTLSRDAFIDLLEVLTPEASSEEKPELDVLLFVHRVETVSTGVYLLKRQRGDSSLLTWLEPRFELRPVHGLGRASLFEVASLAPRELARIARTLHCHQDIAANCCVAFGMLVDLEQALGTASDYRHVLRDAGSLGHTLYLQAEALGLRGTGIGCFFDDAVAELLGLSRSPVRSLYHFSLGKPVDDPRIDTTLTADLTEALVSDD
jgi:SagB-type dehydrogenase family enzyme